MKEKNKKKLVENLKGSLPLIIICIFGALLRFYKLSNIIFHRDESWHTVEIAAKSLPFVLTHDYGSVLYQLLVHLLLPLGKLEFVSRLPAALFGILIILGTYYVGKLFLGKREGLIAALFVSFSHYLLDYSQYARAYTAFAFFSLISLYFFYKAIKENKVKYWILYILFTTINIYAHLFTLVTVGVYISFVGILAVEKLIGFNKKKSRFIDKKKFINFIISTLVIFILIFLLRYAVWIEGTSSPNWIADAVARIQNAPTIGFFPLIHQILTHQIYRYPSLLYFLALLFIIFGIVGCLIRMKKEDILLLLFILLPVLSFYLIKPRAVFFMGADRYFIFILPLIFILLVKGMSFLSSLIISLISQIRFIEKRKYFYRTVTFIIFVLSFFLLQINTLKEYSDYVWKLRSLDLSEKVHHLLKDKAERYEMIFFDSFPDKASVLHLNPLFLENGEKKLMIRSVNRIRFLEKMSHKKYGLWLVLNRSSHRVKELNNFHFNLPGAKIQNIDGNSIIHWKSVDKPLIKNLIEMVEFLIPLRPDKEKEYRLLLAKFYLIDANIKGALQELERANKTKFPSAEDERPNEKEPFFSQLLSKLNIYHKNHEQLALDTLYSDIARQLWILGYKFLSEEKYHEAISAFDKYIQLSDAYHALAAKNYVSLSNLFLRSGRIDEAISCLRKAVKLNPHDYIYRLSLAEAYRKKRMMSQSIEEYRKVFNLPLLSDEFLRRTITKPQLFAIWKGKRIWHFLWKSNRNCKFSGKIYFNRKIVELQKHRITKKDTLTPIKNNGVEFFIKTNKRAMKSLDIDAGKNSQLTCYVEINGQTVTDGIVFINLGKEPTKIPFNFKDQ